MADIEAVNKNLEECAQIFLEEANKIPVNQIFSAPMPKYITNALRGYEAGIGIPRSCFQNEDGSGILPTIGVGDIIRKGGQYAKAGEENRDALAEKMLNDYLALVKNISAEKNVQNKVRGYKDALGAIDMLKGQIEVLKVQLDKGASLEDLQLMIDAVNIAKGQLNSVAVEFGLEAKVNPIIQLFEWRLNQLITPPFTLSFPLDTLQQVGSLKGNMSAAKEKSDTVLNDIKRTPKIVVVDITGKKQVYLIKALSQYTDTEKNSLLGSIAGENTSMRAELEKYFHQGGFQSSGQNAIHSFNEKEGFKWEPRRLSGVFTCTCQANGDIEFEESYQIEQINFTRVPGAGDDVTQLRDSIDVEGTVTCTSTLSLNSKNELQQTDGIITLTSYSPELTEQFEKMEVAVKNKEEENKKEQAILRKEITDKILAYSKDIHSIRLKRAKNRANYVESEVPALFKIQGRLGTLKDELDKSNPTKTPEQLAAIKLEVYQLNGKFEEIKKMAKFLKFCEQNLLAEGGEKYASKVTEVMPKLKTYLEVFSKSDNVSEFIAKDHLHGFENILNQVTDNKPPSISSKAPVKPVKRAKIQNRPSANKDIEITLKDKGLNSQPKKPGFFASIRKLFTATPLPKKAEKTPGFFAGRAKFFKSKPTTLTVPKIREGAESPPPLLPEPTLEGDAKKADVMDVINFMKAYNNFNLTVKKDDKPGIKKASEALRALIVLTPDTNYELTAEKYKTNGQGERELEDNRLYLEFFSKNNQPFIKYTAKTDLGDKSGDFSLSGFPEVNSNNWQSKFPDFAFREALFMSSATNGVTRANTVVNISNDLKKQVAPLLATVPLDPSKLQGPLNQVYIELKGTLTGQGGAAKLYPKTIGAYVNEVGQRASESLAATKTEEAAAAIDAPPYGNRVSITKGVAAPPTLAAPAQKPTPTPDPAPTPPPRKPGEP